MQEIDPEHAQLAPKCLGDEPEKLAIARFLLEDGTVQASGQFVQAIDKSQPIFRFHPERRKGVRQHAMAAEVECEIHSLCENVAFVLNHYRRGHRKIVVGPSESEAVEVRVENIPWDDLTATDYTFNAMHFKSFYRLPAKALTGNLPIPDPGEASGIKTGRAVPCIGIRFADHEDA